MDLINTWASWANNLSKEPPYVLKEDEDYLALEMSSSHVDWKSHIENPHFLDPDEKETIHLGLLPAPYCGNLHKASIFILMLNPGLGPGDHYAEYEGKTFKEALLENLKQTEKSYFFPLDPRFSWTGAFMYWHKKLDGLIQKIKEIKGGSFSEARKFLADHLATIELFPYHSTSFSGGDKLLKNFYSSKLAREYVKGPLLERAKKGEALIIVTRKVNEWGLKHIKNKVIIYNKAGEAQAAHLNPSSRGKACSRGGDAIINFLKNKYGLEK